MKREYVPSPQASFDAAGELRAAAEAILQQRAAPVTANSESLSPQACAQLLHELQVRQIELEMQNEQLRETQQSLNNLLAHYFGFYELAPVGYCSVTKEGLISQANLTTSRSATSSSRTTRTPITCFVANCLTLANRRPVNCACASLTARRSGPTWQPCWSRMTRARPCCVW